METEITSRKTTDSSHAISSNEEKIPSKGERNVVDLWEESVFATLQTYSNVHRGSGHFSMITTRLYERAREVVLEYLGLEKSKYVVVFCSKRGANKIIESLNSSVLGTYNDLEAISRIVHKYGAQLLVDAAQMAAHRTIDMQKSGIDYLAFSAHKMYAPFGSGGLVVRKELLRFSCEELEQINRSGEQNPAGIAALGKAMVLLQRIGMEHIQQEEKRLTAKLLNGLDRIPGVKIFGIKDPDSPGFAYKGGVIPFEIKEMFPQKQARLLSEQSAIGVRYGCHCSHVAIKKMVGVGPFLAKFQRLLMRSFPKLNLPGVVRASVGIGTTEAEVEIFLSTLEKIAAKKSGQQKNRELRLQIEVFIRAAVQRILG